MTQAHNGNGNGAISLNTSLKIGMLVALIAPTMAVLWAHFQGMTRVALVEAAISVQAKVNETFRDDSIVWRGELRLEMDRQNQDRRRELQEVKDEIKSQRDVIQRLLETMQGLRSDYRGVQKLDPKPDGA